MSSLEARVRRMERERMPAVAIPTDDELARLERLLYGASVDGPSISEMVAAFDDSKAILVRHQKPDELGGSRAPRVVASESEASEVQSVPANPASSEVASETPQRPRHAWGRPIVGHLRGTKR